MTLSFSQQINGKPNYFVDKIWNGLLLYEKSHTSDYQNYRMDFNDKFEQDWDYLTGAIYLPKIHTIREDTSDRWKPENDIHFVINNRTANRFQFAPVLKCVSVQSIEIKRYQIPAPHLFPDEYGAHCAVIVDSDFLSIEEMKVLAINDGFENLTDFFRYFNSHFVGKIIHWTDLKY